MWHPRVDADALDRWLRYAVITVSKGAIRVDERRKPASQELGNEKMFFSLGAPQAVKGKVQKGERLLPRSRRAKAGEERDEGPRETEGVTVTDDNANHHEGFMDVADPTSIDNSLNPYSWYKWFVIEDARQHDLFSRLHRQGRGNTGD
jgi:hypothetical protein